MQGLCADRRRCGGNIDLNALSRLPGPRHVLKNALGRVRYYEKTGIRAHDTEHAKKYSFVHGQLDTLGFCSQHHGGSIHAHLELGRARRHRSEAEDESLHATCIYQTLCIRRAQGVLSAVLQFLCESGNGRLDMCCIWGLRKGHIIYKG